MNKKPKLTAQIKIAEIVEYYPELIELLIIDYGFHCIGCVASAFETLEEGALVHGIAGDDLKEMMKRLEAEIKKNS
jgi:hybrid cluster-associated redox disulfide protein